ncbi:matrixin family metalloprotease [Lactobacillus helsingborgensis]|uniref:matrixin family metalloprotease n=1 Tax=Lactobacillus helsingborgensis TaxID=1218494 RepID=UPI002264F97B|nr:matrixin family metalloprotease [Lactobacillus helsingborgensis]UZX31526.1 matrixin family metalloprotease [Lactobacillus helsingborgensis]
MNIKLNNKLIKTAVATLALVTTSATIIPTTVTNLTTVSAKAKKHHKKVKKTKKSKKKSYVIANYYNEFKPGYSYTYNKKKGVFIGHKMKKHQTATIDSDEPKVEQANSTYEVPKVKEFTKDILNQYGLTGDRWSKTNITYNDNALSQTQRQIAEDAINQINNLNIIKLTKSNKKANITIELGQTNTSELALTFTDPTEDEYKNLDILTNKTIKLYDNNIQEYCKGNYNLYLNQTIIHELGHALGLKHNEQSKYEIMAPFANINKIATNDGIHTTIDQDYINGLAILYQN